MGLSVPVRDQLFTTRYRRCGCPVDNMYPVCCDKMAIVPEGVVFVSYSSENARGKTLMFCDYNLFSTTALELFSPRPKLRFSEIMSVTYTGALLVIAAEGNLTEASDSPDVEDLGVWGFIWRDLYDGRVEPVKLYEIPLSVFGTPDRHWGAMASANHRLAILSDGTLELIRPLADDDDDPDEVDQTYVDALNGNRITVPIEQAHLIAVSVAHPQMLVVASDRQLAMARFSEPKDLKNNIVTLPAPPVCVAISENGQMIAAGFSTGLVQVWDTRRLSSPILSSSELESACCSVTFSGSASDRLFAAARNSSEVLVIDTRFFSDRQKIWLPAIPRPSETLSRYDLRSALWPESQDVYELPANRPRNFIATLSVGDIAWYNDDGGILVVGTNEGILFIQCGQRPPPKSVEWM